MSFNFERRIYKKSQNYIVYNDSMSEVELVASDVPPLYLFQGIPSNCPSISSALLFPHPLPPPHPPQPCVFLLARFPRPCFLSLLCQNLHLSKNKFSSFFFSFVFFWIGKDFHLKKQSITHSIISLSPLLSLSAFHSRLSVVVCSMSVFLPFFLLFLRFSVLSNVTKAIFFC